MASARLLLRGVMMASAISATSLSACPANSYFYHTMGLSKSSDFILQHHQQEPKLIKKDLHYSLNQNQAEKSNIKMSNWKEAKTVYDFSVENIDNEQVKLDKYKGKVLLIVNVASKCGFTKTNYKQLNDLYAKYKDQGLAILGFPCNQFGHQEPGCEVDIKEFIKKNGVEWDMFAKVDVNGNDAIPLYNWLKEKQGGFLVDAIKWNFTKFLINKKGIPVSRYAPNKDPLEFESDIKALLEESE